MIAPELVLTVPMANRTGRVAYLKYVSGSQKGGVKRGRVFNSPWALGEMDEDRASYTSSMVVETKKAVADDDQTVDLMWKPVLDTVVVKVNGVRYKRVASNPDDGEYTVAFTHSGNLVDKRFTGDTVGSSTDSNLNAASNYSDGYVTFGNSAGINGGSALIPRNNNPENGISPTAITITFKSALTTSDELTIGYAYDNVVIP